MKNYKKISAFIFTLIIYWPIVTQAQISINQDNSDPDVSAILDVSSTNKGLLIPRMSSLERQNITTPADGLEVYDTDTNSFWYYDNGEWIEIRSSNYMLDLDDIIDTSGICPPGKFLSLNLKATGTAYQDAVIAVNEEYLYVAWDTLNIHDINSLERIAYMLLPSFGNITGINISGNYIYLTSSTSPDLKVIDISIPDAPTLTTSISLGLPSSSAIIAGNYLYILNRFSKHMKIIDISNPSSPVIGGSLTSMSESEYMAISGNYLYVVDSDDRDLKVIDVSDYLNPSIVKSLDLSTPNTAFSFFIDIKVADGYAYILDEFNAKLIVVDLSDPLNPVVLGEKIVFNASSPQNFSNKPLVEVLGNYAYVWDYFNYQIEVYDINDKSNPVFIDSVAVGGGFYPRMAISGNRMYTKIEHILRYFEIEACESNFILGVDLQSGEIIPVQSYNDNLGNHISTQNIELQDNWLSGDGDPEGLKINANGNIGVSGNLGIGVSSPLHQLDLGNTLGRKLALYQNPGGSSFYGFGISGGTLELYAAADVSAEPKMVVKGYTGNIGIGTIDPQKTLHVQGDGGNTRFQSKTPGASSFTEWLSPSGGVRGIVGVDGTGYSGNTHAFAISTWTPHPIVFRTTPFQGLGGMERMRISRQGNVGIGTTFPTSKLDIDGDIEITGSRLNVNSNGLIGIGTNNPTKGKVEINGGVGNAFGYGYLNGSGNTGSNSGSINNQYSLYASRRIAAEEFNAFSDIRIKNIDGISDSEADLNTLMQIEITDYRLKDSISKGNRPIKKVIAQQIAEFYPQAVTKNLTEVVPDIYQRAEVKEGWIMLSTDLQVGDRVKLIAENSNEIYEVIEAEDHRFKIELPPSDHHLSSTIFVYGREVNDFHTVDYEALSMLNVSATQEQQARIEALEKENTQLKQQNTSFESRLEALESLLIEKSASIKK